MLRIVTAISTAVAVLLLGGSANAIFSDHLQCFTIKDPQLKATYTATLTPGDNAFPVAPGCTIKVPAKLLCVDVAKSQVSPPPPGAGPGAQAQKYLCYKAKCPKNKQTAVVQDQFGSRTVKLNATSYACAPFPAPTTTTTTISTTTTTTIFTCLTNNQCPSPPNATGVCTAGQCGFACLTGFADCNVNVVDGCEVSLFTSPSNCGGCGLQCSSNNIPVPTCTGGVCTGACAAGLADCNGNKQADGCEKNLTNDTNNCGGCGTVCPTRPNAVSQCTSATCTFFCNTGFADCDGLPVDGCEVSLVNNPSNCGGCNMVCPPAFPNCVGVTCQ